MTLFTILRNLHLNMDTYKVNDTAVYIHPVSCERDLGSRDCVIDTEHVADASDVCTCPARTALAAEGKPKAKATAKKAAKPTVADAASTVAASTPDVATDAASNRAPISSTPDDVVDVGSAAPAARRTGWWNRG